MASAVGIVYPELKANEIYLVKTHIQLFAGHPLLQWAKTLLTVQDAYFAPFRSTVKTGGQVRKTSASGYIEEWLKSLRVNLSPSKKPHKKHIFRKLIADNAADADPTEEGKKQK